MGKAQCADLAQARPYGPVSRCTLPSGHEGPHAHGPRHARSALEGRPRHGLPEEPYHGEHRTKPKHRARGEGRFNPGYQGKHHQIRYVQPTLPTLGRKPKKLVHDPGTRETFRVGDYRDRDQPPLGVVHQAARAKRARTRRR